jgi:hypothetical protein
MKKKKKIPRKERVMNKTTIPCSAAHGVNNVPEQSETNNT